MHHFTSYVWIWIRHHGHHSGGQHVWMRSRCCSISCQSCTHSAFAFCSPTHTLMSAYCENFVCFLFCFSFHFTVCDIMHLAGYHKYLHLFDLSHRSQMTCAHAYTHTYTHTQNTLWIALFQWITVIYHKAVNLMSDTRICLFLITASKVQLSLSFLLPIYFDVIHVLICYLYLPRLLFFFYLKHIFSVCIHPFWDSSSGSFIDWVGSSTVWIKVMWFLSISRQTSFQTKRNHSHCQVQFIALSPLRLVSGALNIIKVQLWR